MKPIFIRMNARAEFETTPTKEELKQALLKNAEEHIDRAIATRPDWYADDSITVDHSLLLDQDTLRSVKKGLKQAQDQEFAEAPDLDADDSITVDHSLLPDQDTEDIQSFKQNPYVVEFQKRQNNRRG